MDAFEEAGVLTPNQLGEGWTWDALVEAGKRLTRDDNGDGQPERYGFSSGDGMWSHGAFIRQAGGMLFDNYKDPKESRLNTPEVALAMRWYSDLYNVHGVIRSAYQGLQERAVAMDLTSGPNRAVDLAIAQIRYDVAVQPKGPVSRAAYIAQNSIQILKSTQDPELAWNWIKSLAGPEAIREYAAATGVLPAYLPALRDFAEFAPVELPPNMMNALIEVTMDPASFHLPLGTKASQVRTLLNRELKGRLQQGQVPAIESHLEDLHRRVKAILQE